METLKQAAQERQGTWLPAPELLGEAPDQPSLERQGLDGDSSGTVLGWLTSAVSRLGSDRRSNSGTRLCSTSFLRGPRSPTRSPPRPRRTSDPRSPTADARTDSRACKEVVMRAAPAGRGCTGGCELGVWPRGLELPGWGALGEPDPERKAGGAGPAGRGGAHVVQKRWEAWPQLGAQEPHGRPRPQQDPPQGSQRGAHEPSVRLSQRTQERGQQRAHVTHLEGVRYRNLWAAPRRPRRVPPGPAPHLPAVQRQMAEAQQAQPAHGGLGVALPGAEPLQDDLLWQEPCGGPALQQLSAGRGVSRPAFLRRPGPLGGQVPSHPSAPILEAGSPR